MLIILSVAKLNGVAVPLNTAAIYEILRPFYSLIGRHILFKTFNSKDDPRPRDAEGIIRRVYADTDGKVLLEIRLWNKPPNPDTNMQIDFGDKRWRLRFPEKS